MPDSPVITFQHFDLGIFAWSALNSCPTDGVSLPGTFWLCVHLPTNLQGFGSSARPCSCNSRMQLLLNPWRSTALSGACPVQVSPPGLSVPWVGSACLEIFPPSDWASFPAFYKSCKRLMLQATYACVSKGKEGIRCGALAGIEQPNLPPNFYF